MRHRKAGVKLNRTASHRNAMFRNMVTSLFKYDRIRTTDAKAKELRRLADNMVTLAKRGDLHARRQALAIMREKTVVHKLFENANERFGHINGGYTRVVKLGRRPGDAAPIAVVELVVAETEKKKKKKAVAVKDAPTTDSKKTDPVAPVEPEAEEEKSLKEEIASPSVAEDDAAEKKADDVKSADAGEDIEAVKEEIAPEPEAPEAEETRESEKE